MAQLNLKRALTFSMLMMPPSTSHYLLRPRNPHRGNISNRNAPKASKSDLLMGSVCRWCSRNLASRKLAFGRKTNPIQLAYPSTSARLWWSPGHFSIPSFRRLLAPKYSATHSDSVFDHRAWRLSAFLARWGHLKSIMTLNRSQAFNWLFFSHKNQTTCLMWNKLSSTKVNENFIFLLARILIEFETVFTQNNAISFWLWISFSRVVTRLISQCDFDKIFTRATYSVDASTYTERWERKKHTKKML